MYKLTFYSKRYGELETETYSKLADAKRYAGKRIRNTSDHDGYNLYDATGSHLHHEDFGYDHDKVLMDFKAYAKCCRDEIGGWELFPESFRWFVYHGYIVPAEDYLRLECGAWELTPRFRAVGLAVRNGELPPEFETEETEEQAAA